MTIDSATLFTGGTIWTGHVETDALLIDDGVVVAVGDDARDGGTDAKQVDLEGGFLMPSFGDGHAHPLYGGLEAAGPPVRECNSVDEILLAVKQYAAEHPDQDWIVGASYDGSLAPDGLSTRSGSTRPSPTVRWCCGLGLSHRVVQHRRAPARRNHRRYPGPRPRQNPTPG